MDPIHQFQIKNLFTIGTFGGHEIAFTNSAAYMVVAVVLTALLMLGGTAGRRLVPTRMQSMAELSYEFVAEMLRSMERDGPLATEVSFCAVLVVVVLTTGSFRGAFTVICALVMGVLWAVGGGALNDMKLNFLNFIALPITFGIGCEYPFNVFDRSRLLGGDITSALRRTGGAVALCSFTTAIGYSSLLFADNQALQSFGRLAMSGELACLIAALFVVPSILHVWKSKTIEKAEPH